MPKTIYNFRATVWLYPGMAAWHFVTLPKNKAKEIKEKFSKKPRRGWGSIRVKITVGKTSWESSIFPDKKLNSYVLPIKAEVRKKEDIESGDQISLKIQIK